MAHGASPDIDIDDFFDDHPEVDRSGGGSGEWVHEHTNPDRPSAKYEEQVTGHKPGITYEVPSDHAPSGRIRVDDVEPAHDGQREKWVDAKYDRPDYAYNKDGTIDKIKPPYKEMTTSIDKQYATAEQHDAEVEWVVSDERQLRDVQDYITKSGYGDRFRVRLEPPK